MAGGFTAVATVSSTNPPIHSKSEVQYIKNKTLDEIVDVYPIGTLSHNREGKDLSEMYDMHLAGAIAFSDDKRAVEDSGLLLRALQYSQNFGGLIITHCNDRSLSVDGKINEGEVSAMLGLKGIPALAEEVMVTRNINLAEYLHAPIHIANITTKKSVELIKQAKEKGLRVTASVNSYNLALDDSFLMEFDSNYKVNPPLRTKADIEALLKGIADGTIDAITSDHRPQEIETKNLEFDNASSGMIGLEILFAIANSNKGRIKLESLIETITINPRSILKLPNIKLDVEEVANLTLFNPNEKWVFEKKHIKSKSFNSPFLNTTFTGKVIGTYNKKHLSLNG